MAKSLETKYFRKNLNAYMEINGIDTYANLLIKIGRELGLTGDELYNFPAREKSNFSKMLNGTRVLKAEYIMPLEKILGVSLTKLLNEQLFIEPDSKEIPFLNGFRYYTHLDDYNRYGELLKMTTPSGELIIKNCDEFNKSFLDYVVEYNAINAIKYLAEKHNLKINTNGQENIFVIDEHDYLYTNSKHNILEMIICEDDPKLFNQVFDIEINPVFDNIPSYLKEDWFISDILKSEKILESLLKTRKFKFSKVNIGVEPKNGLKPDVELFNPLLVYCLQFALKHLNHFKTQVIKILKFAFEHNKLMLTKLEKGAHYYIEHNFILYESYRVCRGSMLEINETTSDQDINQILRDLPKLTQ